MEMLIIQQVCNIEGKLICDLNVVVSRRLFSDSCSSGRPGKNVYLLEMWVKFPSRISKFPIISYIVLYSVKQDFSPNSKISQEWGSQCPILPHICSTKSSTIWIERYFPFGILIFAIFRTKCIIVWQSWSSELVNKTTPLHCCLILLKLTDIAKS